MPTEMPLDGKGENLGVSRTGREQTALDQGESENMQGHLFGPPVLRQHFNGDMWSLEKKPAAEAASWVD